MIFKVSPGSNTCRIPNAEVGSTPETKRKNPAWPELGRGPGEAVCYSFI